RDIKSPRSRGDILAFHITIFIWKIDKFLKWDHLDGDLRFVLPHKFLRVIRAVERFARGILSRPCMVAANNEMIRSVVAADDCMEQRFLWTSHTHCQWQQAERCT